MKVLIACEFSGKIRDAFSAVGHNAWSCDLLPTEKPGNHYQGDVRDILYEEDWDLMIAHPPCNFLSFAGNKYWNAPGRAEKRNQAFSFFMELINAPIKKICVENPLGYANTAYRKPDQIIHPYLFGEPHLKRTCLWLKGLPKLFYTFSNDLFFQRTATDYPNPIYVDKLSKKKRYFTEAHNSSKKRSYTFDSIAIAMAKQWGCL